MTSAGWMQSRDSRCGTTRAYALAFPSDLNMSKRSEYRIDPHEVVRPGLMNGCIEALIGDCTNHPGFWIV